LLQVARERVHARVSRARIPTLTPDPELRTPAGAFVTLWVGGELRGCMGSLEPEGPVVELVARMADEALRDPRFLRNPLGPRELCDLRIEVSVLGPLQRVRGPEAVAHGLGVVVEIRGRSGCFLPQVAIERGWSAEETLDRLCQHKLGLPAGAWRLPIAQIYTFTAEALIEPGGSPSPFA
jgi:AmmeMemoRadiSam system protein A